MKRVARKIPKIKQKRVSKLSQNNMGIVIDERGVVGAGIVNFVFGIILTVLALRFVLRLLGANGANAFVSTIYNFSQPLVAPFFGIFNYQAQLETARFEIATLIALLVYGIIAGILARVLFTNRHHA